MNKLNYLLYSLGILSLLAYFPLLISIGIWAPKLGQHGGSIALVMLAPLIISFILIGIASRRMRKAKKFKLENQLEKSETLNQLNPSELIKLKLENLNYSGIEIEQMRQEILKLQKNNLIFGFGLIVLFLFGPNIFASITLTFIPQYWNGLVSFIISLLIVIVYITTTPKFNKKISELKIAVKIWFLQNKIKILGLTNLQYIPKNIGEKLRSVFFISKMGQLNSNLENFGIDEVMAFEYKTKTIELIDFWIKFSSKNSVPHFYLCLTTTNPDQIEGRTVAWHDSNWHFKDDGLQCKIRTESPVFDRIFKTFASDQMNARMHLNTSIMQDMIELQEALAKKKVVFYFDKSQIYIIFETVANPLEIDINQPLDQISDVSLKTDIELVLKIFDEFWLSRKSGFYEVRQ